jgi:pantoate--beta-alanine ligase
MQIVQSIQELRDALLPFRAGRIGFAPTMGFLHAGHQTLFRRAAAENDVAVASVFVNPTQFNDPADLAKYPRDPEGDAAKAREAGIGILWMPGPEHMYASGHSTTVSVAGLTDGLCGATRPGHFDGVATVVTKLFNAVQPTHAYFGQKDFQQLAVIRRMVRDLNMPLEIIGVPTVRESDGLAMSSRNVHLSADERRSALAISRSLFEATAQWAAGERDADVLVAGVRSAIEAEPVMRIDYVNAVDPDDLRDLAGAVVDAKRGVVIALAAFCGRTRLIDNLRIDAPND